MAKNWDFETRKNESYCSHIWIACDHYWWKIWQYPTVSIKKGVKKFAKGSVEVAVGLGKNEIQRLFSFRLQTEILPLSMDEEDFAVDYNLTLPSSMIVNGIAITFPDNSSCQNDQLGRMDLQ